MLFNSLTIPLTPNLMRTQLNFFRPSCRFLNLNFSCSLISRLNRPAFSILGMFIATGVSDVRNAILKPIFANAFKAYETISLKCEVVSIVPRLEAHSTYFDEIRIQRQLLMRGESFMEYLPLHQQKSLQIFLDVSIWLSMSTYAREYSR